MKKMVGKLEGLILFFYCLVPFFSLFSHVSSSPFVVFAGGGVVGGDRCLFLHNSRHTRRRMVSPSCLILPTKLAGLLVCVPDISRLLNSPVRRSTMHQDETNG